MFDPATIVGFDWDAGNERKSADERGVGQSETEQVFFNQPLLVLEDDRHSLVESRFHALGETNEGRQLRITFTLRRDDTLIRVISARDGRRKERAVYEQSP